MPFSVYVYLVNKGYTSTPSAAEELELSQAGLGKRSLTLTDDMSHEMVLPPLFKFKLIIILAIQSDCMHTIKLVNTVIVMLLLYKTI